MAVDSIGNVYVVDSYNRYPSIQKFDSNGVFLTKWGQSEVAAMVSSSTPTGVAVDSIGNVYVADTYNNSSHPEV